MARARLRDLGITTGVLPTGRWNAITDVAGVRVGFSTLVRDTPSVVRTGVTAIWPRGGEVWNDCCFAALAPMIEDPFLALTIGGIAALLTIALVVAVSVVL